MGIGIMNYQTTRYTYDRLGNRTSKRDVLAEQAGADLDEIYTYDQQNQLIDLDRIGNHEHFHYDTTGNWLAYQQNGTLQTRTHNAANEIVSVDGSDTSLRTDAAGNMTRIPNPKAVPGQTVAQNLNLTYDAWNRLIRVSTPDGSEVMSCSYDGLNRRVRKTTASETREYYYNKNWQCLEEYLYGTLQNSYLWGLRYLDDLICFTPDYTIALTDANFNVVAVANQSGLTERYTYTAFGQRTILTPSYAPRSESVYPALTRTFTSQVLDYETGLMLYRNRCYAPTLGRFIVRDPIGYYGNDTNFYRYVWNASLIYADFLGLDKHHLFPQKIKGLIEAKCKGLNIDDYTIVLDPWGKGGSHTAIHYPEGEESYNKKMRDLVKKKGSCCDFVKEALDYFEESITTLNQKYPSIGDNPEVCPYKNKGYKLTLKEMREQLLKQFCRGNFPSQPYSPPNSVPVVAPDNHPVLDTINGFVEDTREVITTHGPTVAVAVGLGVVAVAVGTIMASVGTAGLVPVMTAGALAIVGSWWWKSREKFG